MTSSQSIKRDKRNGKILGPHCKQFLGYYYYCVLLLFEKTCFAKSIDFLSFVAKIGLMKSGNLSDHSIEIDDHECIRSSETVKLNFSIQ